MCIRDSAGAAGQAPRRGRRLLLAGCFGLVTALMNVAFYEAIATAVPNGSPTGFVLALVAAAFWAAYIVLGNGWRRGATVWTT